MAPASLSYLVSFTKLQITNNMEALNSLLTQHPARHFVVAREPDAGKAFHVVENLVEHGRHHRPAADLEKVADLWRGGFAA